MRRTLIATFAALLLPGAAAAAPFEPVGEAKFGSLATDHRHAAFEEPGGTVRLFDTVTGRRTSHPRPRDDCRFADVGGGKLMWSCGTGPQGIHIVVLTIETGQVQELDRHAGEIGGDYDEVGRYWIRGHGSDHRGGNHTIYYSLVDSGSYEVDTVGDARSVPDLNVRGLQRPLCHPLRRVERSDYDPDFDPDRYWPYQYDGRFGLYLDQGAWTLDRCGRSTSTILPQRAGGARLVKGRLTWSKGTKLVAHDVRTKRSWSWRRNDIDPAATGAGIEPTSRALFVVTHTGSELVQRVYTAPFPR